MQEGQTPRRSARSAALRRVTRVKRWVAGGALALTGMLSAMAAQVLPASHAKARPVSPTTSAPATDDGTAAPSQTAVPSIAPPAQAPQASSSSSGIVSGGS